MARTTSDSLTTRAASEASTEGGCGHLVSGWGSGCLAFRAAMEASPSLATESSEQANWTAPLKSPSSSFSDTLDARNCRGS